MTESSHIIILSRPIQTGKTTSLVEWADGNPGVIGIAQPVIERKRCLKDLHTNEVRLLETEEDGGKIIPVGKYKFLKSSFEWAKIVLLHAAAQKPGWLIIDEFGKLELKDKGLQPVITHLVNNEELLNTSNLILVVRDSLLDQAIVKLNLEKKVKVISSLKDLDI